MNQSQHERQRIAFGDELKMLRKSSNLTGVALGKLTGISQSKLSKIETGALIPSTEDLIRMLQILKVSTKASQRLVEAARALRTEYLSWRFEHRRGFGPKQLQVAELERGSRVIRELRVEAIPGLLQTREYAQRIMTLANSTSQLDLEWAVSLRMQRQEILYDPERRFEFLIYEAGALSRFCENSIAARQLERLRFIANSPNIRIGLIPSWVPLSRALINSFVVIDSSTAVFESFTGEISTSDSQDIEMYMSIFEEFSSIALFGEDAARYLREIELTLVQGEYEKRATDTFYATSRILLS